MNDINVMQYVLEKLENKYQDPEARKKALITIMTKLLDKGITDIPTEDDPETKGDGFSVWAGYADDLTAKSGQKEIIDEMIESYTKNNYSLLTLKGNYKNQLSVPTNNVFRTVFGENMKYDEIMDVLAVDTGKPEERKYVYVLLQKNNEMFLQVMRKLNQFDKLVFCGVCDLIKRNIYQVTGIQLWRYIHNDPNLKPTPEQLKMLGDSLHTMMGIVINLDVKEIFENYPEISKIQTAGNFIEVQKWAERKTANGTVSEYYVLGHTMPILMQYANVIGQMQTLDAIGCSFYDTNIRKTALNLQAVNMIAERLTTIKGMKAKGKRVQTNMHVLSFEKLLNGIDYSTCKSDSAKLNKRKRQIKQIEKHLMFQQTRNNVQYTIEKTGITIDVD